MPSNGGQQPPDKDDQQPSGGPGQGPSQRPERPSQPSSSDRPEYTVYRSRRGLLSGLRATDVAGLRERARRSYRRLGRGGPKDEEQKSTGPKPLARRALKWFAIAAAAWVLISFIAFGISAQIQSSKLAGDVGGVLSGGSFMLVSPQTILVIGTDARPTNTKEPGAAPSKQCFDQQARGETPHGPCGPGQFRSDTLMLIRAGGGTFNKLSIPRDSLAEIPGHEPQKINAAYTFGGAKLEIQTVEKFLNIKINHVAIIDFTGFQKFIDALGGVEVNVPHRVCSEISGGAANGGITLKLSRGVHTMNGQTALAYARTRENPCAHNYTDANRAAAQQAVIAGIKGRLTDPLRIPYNFIHGPIIGWDAPKAFVSDMGFFSMPQLVLSAAIGGSSGTDVLCGTSLLRCSIDPATGDIIVPQSVRNQAVKRLMG